MREQAFIIRDSGRVMHGVRHVPDGRGESARATVLFIGGPRWSSWGPHRLIVDAARACCAAGFSAIRFDELGGRPSGDVHIDSIGDGEAFVDVTARAVEFIRDEGGIDIRDIIFAGFCAGADITANLLAGAGARGIVLWSIRLSMYRHRDETVAGYLARPEFERIAGRCAGRRASSAGGPDIVDRRTPLLVVNGDRYSAHAADEGALLELFPSAAFSVTYREIAGGDQFFSSVNATEQVIETTVSWLLEECDNRG